MLLDSNIIIYAARPDHQALRQLIAEHAPAVSAVSYVEVLGYHSLSENEKRLFQAFFESSMILSIDQAVLEQAVQLRQQRKISLGDALIAATAMVNRLELITHNHRDFSWIDGLKIFDPLQSIESDDSRDNPKSAPVN